MVRVRVRCDGDAPEPLWLGPGLGVRRDAPEPLGVVQVLRLEA